MAALKELAMNGKIRTREKCPKCGQKFHVIEEQDILCPQCNTRPSTFYIWLYWQGKKPRISRDRDGHMLDSYKRAHRLLESIRQSIQDRTFNLSNYLPKEIEQFKAYKQLPLWLADKEAENRSPSHLREVRRYIKSYYEPLWGDHDCRELDTHHVRDFLRDLPSHLSAKTKKNILVMLKNFCHWLQDGRILVLIPKFPTISVEEKPIKWIPKEVQMKVLRSLHPHHVPLFNFMIHHPLRPGEARALKVKDINLELSVVHIHSAFTLKRQIKCRKNKKPYYLPLSDTFDNSLLRDKLPEAFVFVNKHGNPYGSEGIRKLWKKACKRAGVPYINPYNATRHSIASQAVNRGVDLNTVSQALGHSSLEMTKKYASLNVQMLKSVIDGGEAAQYDDGAQEVHKEESEKVKALKS